MPKTKKQLTKSKSRKAKTKKQLTKSKSKSTKTKKTTKKSIHKQFNGDKKKKKKTVNIYENSDYVDDKKKKKKSVNIYKNSEYVDDKKKKKKTNTSLLSGSVSGTYDDKKKKKVENIDIEKQKKIIEKITETKLENMTDEEQKNIKLDSMKKTLCNLRYGNFHDIDVSDRTPYWGLGIEHEMQLFHKSPSGMKNTNILFDSQESACFLTNEKDESGSCCKTRLFPQGKCDDFSENAKKYNAVLPVM